MTYSNLQRQLRVGNETPPPPAHEIGIGEDPGTRAETNTVQRTALMIILVLGKNLASMSCEELWRIQAL